MNRWINFNIFTFIRDRILTIEIEINGGVRIEREMFIFQWSYTDNIIIRIFLSPHAKTKFINEIEADSNLRGWWLGEERVNFRFNLRYIILNIPYEIEFQLFSILFHRGVIREENIFIFASDWIYPMSHPITRFTYDNIFIRLSGELRGDRQKFKSRINNNIFWLNLKTNFTIITSFSTDENSWLFNNRIR